MKNEEKFKEQLENAAFTQLEIKDDINPLMSNLGKMFKLAFGEPKFKFINDMVFFRGGYPKEDSPAKMKSVLDSIGNLYKFFKMRSKDDIDRINAYLKEQYEIEIIPYVNTEKIHDSGIKKFSKFCELWKETFGVDYKQESHEEILNKIINYGQELKKEICDKLDSVKTDAENIEAECEIKKSYFMKSVNLKVVEKIKGKDTLEEKITQIEEDRNQFDKCIELLTSSK